MTSSATLALNRLWAAEVEEEPPTMEGLVVARARVRGREEEGRGRLLLTLEREGEEQAWGFSMVGGHEVRGEGRTTS